VDINCRAAGPGGHIQLVHWTLTGRYIQDADDPLAAIEAAKAESGSPSIVALRSIIASPLAAEEVAATKKPLGSDPERDLVVDDRVLARKAVERGRAANQDWQKAYDVWRCEQPDNAELPTVWAKAVIEHEDAPGRSWTKRATTAWPVSVVCWARAVAITVSAIVCGVLTPRLARTAISRRRPLAAGRGLVAGEQVSAPRCLDKPEAGFGRPPGPRGSAYVVDRCDSGVDGCSAHHPTQAPSWVR